MTQAAADRVVIMVEDHPEVLDLGREMLEDAGFAVIAFETADQALGAIEAGEPCDLLFTDIVMPGGIDGLELASRAGQLRPDLPVLLTTGWSDQAHDQKSSGYPLIGKPYRQADLVGRVEELLDTTPTSDG
ncbi:hypothetical protein GCM10009422_18850 [Brevundimonas kwangchunensis]|uniref:Response regulatory domain-containing protein n=1 Tax=Brevundimonas kwangchunensis TaxID=322163 RepID=A0ABP3S1K7_9CAUL